MADEFESNVAILDKDMVGNIALIDRMAAFVAIPAEQLTTLSQSEFESRVFGPDSLIRFHEFDPAMGIAQALVKSQDLSRVEDRELRLHLANWSALLDEKVRVNKNGSRVLMDLYGPIARWRSDGQWSAEERLELKYRIDYLRYQVDLVINNQRRLRAEADSIVDILDARRQ